MKRKRATKERVDPRIFERVSALQRKKTGNVSRAEVNRMVNQALSRSHDLKGVDLNFNGTATTTLTDNSAAHLINPLILGTGSFRRADRSVSMESIRVRWGLTFTYDRHAVSGNVENTTYRISIVYDKKPEASIPTWSNVFANLDNAGAFTQTLRSSVSFTNTDRFSVLRDEVGDLNPNFYYKGGVLDDKCKYSISGDWYINMRGKKSIYGVDKTTANVTDFEEGAVYVFVRVSHSDTHAVTGYAGTVRMRYRDN